MKSGTSRTWSFVPLLILDDVFSELDADRADALFAALPPGQVLLTTAGAVPSAAAGASRLLVGTDGSITTL